MQNRKKKWLLASTGCLVATVCMVGAGVFLQERSEPPVHFSPPLLQEKKPVRPAPVSRPEQREQPSSVEKPAVISGNTPDTPLLVQSGVVRRLTHLQAQFEEKKLEVAIAKENQKLQELLTPPVPQRTQVVPQQVVPALPDLPDLAGLSITPAKSAPRKRAPFYVVSIQGLEGNLTASVATPSGQKTVRVGDSVGSKRVAAISVNGVTLKADGRMETLDFKE